MTIRTITTLSLVAAFFVASTTFAPTADAQEATRTIEISAHGVFGPKIEEAEKAFKKLKGRMMDAEGDAFDALSRKANSANKELKALKKQARRFKGGTITFYGVDLDLGLADSIRDWFINRPNEKGGAYHVYFDNGQLVMTSNPPKQKKAKKKPARRRSQKAPRGGGKAPESKVHKDATIFGQG